MEDQILEAYKSLLSDKAVFTWKALAEASGASEEEIRQHFPTRDALDIAIWREIVFHTIAKTKAEPVYAEYTARERMLSFYFTLIEELKADRALALIYLESLGILDIEPIFLKEFFIHFRVFVKEILDEGIETGQIPKRYWISTQYSKAHHLQALYVLRTWAEDTSENQVRTDGAIEKSVNLAFDLMERNFFDSAWDFGKFLFGRN